MTSTPPTPPPADLVERFVCPACGAQIGGACRSRSGDTAFRYHTARFVLVTELAGVAEILVPEDRGPGRPWTPPGESADGERASSDPGSRDPASREPAPAVLAPSVSAPALGRGAPTSSPPLTVLRIGYASCSLADEDELTGQLRALAAARCDRVFSEQIIATVKRRPELVHAVRAADEARSADTGRPVALTATELRRVARTSRELMELASDLAAREIRLELLTGPVSGMFDPRGEGRLLFEVLAAATSLDIDHLRAKKLEGQRSAANEGRPPGRPRALDDGMLALARRLRGEGVPVAEIAERLTIATGKNAGRHPSAASVYRALAELDVAGTAGTAQIAHVVGTAGTAQRADEIEALRR
ncbi:MAG: recombinase family protein [Actinocrinis sp.]